MEEKQATEGMREALESTNTCLRRLVKTIKDSQEGDADQEALELWIRRSRRRLRVNRELLGEGGQSGAGEDGDEPDPAPQRKAGNKRARAESEPAAPRRRRGRARSES